MTTMGRTLEGRTSSVIHTMIDKVKTWFQENHTLIYFLIGQAIALGGIILSLTAYSVRLESRVNTLETRGSPHLDRVESRLNVLEDQTRTNRERTDRIVSVLTRDLGKDVR